MSENEKVQIFEQLNQVVRKIVNENGGYTTYAVEDLKAYTKLSVKDMAKMYDYVVLSGGNRREALKRINEEAIEKRRREEEARLQKEREEFERKEQIRAEEERIRKEQERIEAMEQEMREQMIKKIQELKEREEALRKKEEENKAYDEFLQMFKATVAKRDAKAIQDLLQEHQSLAAKYPTVAALFQEAEKEVLRLQAVEKLTAALSDAINSGSSEELATAIADAKSSEYRDVTLESLLNKAQLIQQVAISKQEIEVAMEGNDYFALHSAIKKAVAIPQIPSTLQVLIEAAQAKEAVLAQEIEENNKRLAQEQLIQNAVEHIRSAVQQRDSIKLKYHIQAAVKIGANSNELNQALQEAFDVEKVLDQEMKIKELIAAISDATKGKNEERLKFFIAEAKTLQENIQAGIRAELKENFESILHEASEHAAHLESQRLERELISKHLQVLESTMQSNQIDQLKEAIEAVPQSINSSQLIAESLETAQKKLESLQLEAERIGQTLHDAISSQDVELLKMAIETAEQSSISSGSLSFLIQEAKANYKDACEKRDLINSALSGIMEAVMSGDAKSIEKAIEEAEHIGFTHIELEKAIIEARAVLKEREAMQTAQVAEEPKVVEPDFELTEEPSENPIPEYKVNIAALETRQYLRARFDVIKLDPHSTLFSKKARTWECDYFGGKFNNLSRKGVIKKSMIGEKLLLLEKPPADPLRLRMKFFGANHPYDLVFTDNFSRERCYESCAGMRSQIVNWCPALCKPGEAKSKTELFGTILVNSQGKMFEIPGSRKIIVASKPYEPISVFCATWNMKNCAAPRDQSALQDLIVPNAYDIYAISVQKSGFSKHADYYSDYMRAAVGNDYVVVAFSTMWDMQLIILTKKQHLIKIKNIEVEQKPAKQGNKGCIAIGLSFYETSLLFINAHLPSQKKEGAESMASPKNLGLADIMGSLKIKNKSLEFTSQFHHAFFMGDLNYKLDVDYEQGVKLLTELNVAELAVRDQLNTQREKQAIFAGWGESAIKFLPTTRCNVGNDGFDMSKMRVPSYADRILFKSLPGAFMHCTQYSSVPNIQMSSHRPVFAAFKVNVLRPYLSIFSKAEPQPIITFDTISVRGREEKIKKPVLTFYAEFIKQFEETAKLGETSTPSWTSKNTPKIIPATHQKDFLKTQFLTVALRDGPTKLESLDNLIATAVIPLKLIVSDPEQASALTFVIPMYRHGQQVCHMEVVANVQYK